LAEFRLLVVHAAFLETEALTHRLTESKKWSHAPAVEWALRSGRAALSEDVPNTSMT